MRHESGDQEERSETLSERLRSKISASAGHPRSNARSEKTDGKARSVQVRFFLRTHYQRCGAQGETCVPLQIPQAVILFEGMRRVGSGVLMVHKARRQGTGPDRRFFVVSLLCSSDIFLALIAATRVVRGSFLHNTVQTRCLRKFLFAIFFFFF